MLVACDSMHTTTPKQNKVLQESVQRAATLCHWMLPTPTSFDPDTNLMGKETTQKIEKFSSSLFFLYSKKL